MCSNQTSILISSHWKELCYLFDKHISLAFLFLCETRKIYIDLNHGKYLL